jgi:hypothetical protein
MDRPLLRVAVIVPGGVGGALGNGTVSTTAPREVSLTKPEPGTTRAAVPADTPPGPMLIVGVG